MNFGRRQARVEAGRAEALHAAHEINGDEPIDPIEFVDSHETTLQDTARRWHDIARTAREREVGYTEHIHRALTDSWLEQGHAGVPDEAIVERDAERLGADLTVYGLLVTRHLSASPMRLNTKSDILHYFHNIPNPLVSRIIRSKDFPTRRFMARQVGIISAMQAADDKGRKVLADLTSTYAVRPDDLEALAGLYENDDAAEVDPRFAELRQIVAADWHAPDAPDSVLHNFCKRLQSSPESYIHGFIEMVGHDERNQRIKAIRDMARFAIIATGGNPDDPDAIRQSLLTTYRRWHEAGETGVLFDAYVQGRINDLETNFAKIAGPLSSRNIRMYPSADQIDSFRDHIGAYHVRNRRDRRHHARTINRAYNADKLPSAADIERLASCEELVQEPKKLMVAKQGERGYVYMEADIEDILAKYQLYGTHTEADVRLMLEWLRRHPISRASQVLKSKKITHGNKQIPLRRFAPNLVPELPISGNNRFMRIVYARIDGSLAITNILDHNTFDQIYA